MRKTPITLQELRKRIYMKAKADQAHRFWGESQEIEGLRLGKME